jgi:hypothetical protein
MRVRKSSRSKAKQHTKKKNRRKKHTYETKSRLHRVPMLVVQKIE